LAPEFIKFIQKKGRVQRVAPSEPLDRRSDYNELGKQSVNQATWARHEKTFNTPSKERKRTGGRLI